MTKEQAIEILKCFKDNKIQRDKLEIDNRCGGWKIGRIYKSLELNTAIETVLSMLEEKDKTISSKDKIIDLMANHIVTSDSDLCEYLDITTKCKYYAGENGKLCDDCIKQYFKNKAKELLNK